MPAKTNKKFFGGREQNPESQKHVIYNIQDTIQTYQTYEQREEHAPHPREKITMEKINGDDPDVEIGRSKGKYACKEKS